MMMRSILIRFVTLNKEREREGGEGGEEKILKVWNTEKVSLEDIGLNSAQFTLHIHNKHDI